MPLSSCLSCLTLSAHGAGSCIQAADSIIQKLLALCGVVRAWRPTRDPATGRMKGFGFVDFVNAEACLRAVECLNGLEVAGRALLVKPNKATEAFLKHFKERREANGTTGDEGPGIPSARHLPQTYAELKEQVHKIADITAAAVAKGDAARLEAELMGARARPAPTKSEPTKPAAAPAPSSAAKPSQVPPGPPPVPPPGPPPGAPASAALRPAPAPASASKASPEPERGELRRVASPARPEEPTLEKALRHGRERRRRERDSRAYADRERRWEDREASLAKDRGRDLDDDADAFADRQRRIAADERPRGGPDPAAGAEDARRRIEARLRGERPSRDEERRRKRRRREADDDAEDEAREQRRAKEEARKAERLRQEAAEVAAEEAAKAAEEAAKLVQEEERKAERERKEHAERERSAAAARAVSDRQRQKQRAAKSIFENAEAAEREEEASAKRMRPLVPIDYDEDDKAPAVAMGKRGAVAASELLKSLNSRLKDKASPDAAAPSKQAPRACMLPTDMSDSEVIAASGRVQWAKLSPGAMAVERTKLWAESALTSLVGGDEETADEIASFVMDKLSERISADAMLEEVRPFLDEDAEPFVANLFRRLLAL